MLGAPKLSAVGAALLGAALIAWKPAYSWTAVLAGLLLVILFIPIRRYTLGVNLPFELEPYRVALLLIVAAWAFSLLADARVRLRRTPIDAPVLAIALTVLLSIGTNLGRVAALQGTVTKAVLFLISYLVLFFVVTSVVRTRSQLDRLIKVLVVGGAAIGGLAILERQFGYNPYSVVFDHLPGFETIGYASLQDDRGARATGPAQHPIALGAALVMLVPLAVALAYRTAKKRWWVAASVMTVAAFATLSRTAVVMLAVVAVVLFWLRRAESLRAAPLVVVLVVAVHFAVPGALGTTKALFFPKGGLFTEQSNVWAPVNPEMPNWCTFAGRAADLGPVLGEAAERPLLGYGYGTRVTIQDASTGVAANACVLDNQWLGTLLDAGAAGLVAWLWLFLRFIRRVGAAAKRADRDTAWLLTALVAAVAACAVGMLFFDAFTFIQVMLLLFVVLALGASALADVETPERGPRGSAPTVRRAR